MKTHANKNIGLQALGIYVQSNFYVKSAIAVFVSVKPITQKGAATLTESKDGCEDLFFYKNSANMVPPDQGVKDVGPGMPFSQH